MMNFNEFWFTGNGDVGGSLEGKMTLKPHGVTITKKWNTANVVSGTIGVENKLIDGLKVDLDGSLAPVTGKEWRHFWAPRFS